MMLIEVSPCEVLLVTGGWQGGWYPMLSTELLVPGSGSWRLTGLLHRPMEGVGVATVDNTVFLTGDYIVHYCELGPCIHIWTYVCIPGGYDGDYDYGGDYDYDEILQFDAATEEWGLAGRMVEPRGYHAVSTINFEDVGDVCVEKIH